MMGFWYAPVKVMRMADKSAEAEPTSRMGPPAPPMLPGATASTPTVSAMWLSSLSEHVSSSINTLKPLRETGSLSRVWAGSPPL